MDENTGDVSPTNGRPTDRERWARWARPAAFGAAGLLAGGLFAGTLSASAADSTPSEDGRTGTTAPAQPGNGYDPGQRGAEELLTGSTADKVEAAVLAEYPEATIVRLETDSDGVYEAHITTGEGERLSVEVDEDFTVTGEGAHGGPAGSGGPCPPPHSSTTDAGATVTSLSTWSGQRRATG